MLVTLLHNKPLLNELGVKETPLLLNLTIKLLLIKI